MPECELLPENGKFVIESYYEMNQRYLGFGKDLFQEIYKARKLKQNSIKFFKRIDSQIIDSYAIVTNINSTVAIQLDPECEKIIIWNSIEHYEKGDWITNHIDDSIKTIQLLLSSPKNM